MSIHLSSCPKVHTRELDKAIAPEQTVSRVKERLQKVNLDILATTRRVDVGRLGIPVYLSVCGADARVVMPTRKQMGKGASSIQAEASALMELMERFSFFTFWQTMPHMVTATWSEAERRFGTELLPVEQIIRSVNDTIDVAQARRLLELVSWQFFPVTDLTTGKNVWAPLNWFKKLGEFNGTSAGNTTEESLLQGLCELVERHVCCLIDRQRPSLPTISCDSIDDPVLQELLAAFAREDITIILKDFSLDMPVPTVGAIAWDASTFPHKSEIVFTAGTAATPAKAAIRAVTEVAQLAGDFCTSACYEASGLTKFTNLAATTWVQDGPLCPLNALPSVEADDIMIELQRAVAGLQARGYTTYATATTHPELDIPTHYCFAPGLAFRERDKNQCVGLFVGRILAEEADLDSAEQGFAVLNECCPNAHYMPFFRGILALRQDAVSAALVHFMTAEPLQPENDSRGLTAFYTGYCHTLLNQWQAAIPPLTRAIEACPDMKEYWNLRGVAYYKTQQYAAAAEDFAAVLHIDKGSVMDIANLGVCQIFLGNKDAARHYLETALRLDPALDFARTHLASLDA